MNVGNMNISKKRWLAAWFLATLTLSGCSGRKAASQNDTGNSAEADKLIYERAENDLKHSRFEVARLTLQTLINTYPDSEYLAKAKLAIADSYFKEGSTGGLTQAVAEYQDFITFFPFLDEAAYAQMQIGMAHYHRMEKSDRDRSEALEAEAAFQTYLQKYPNSEFYAQAQQRLREVQEVLAEGDYRIANFYYIRRADRASASRLLDLVNRYPLYSQADRANWMLASVYDRTEHGDVAAQYYARIVKQYPLSSLAAEAKGKLVKFGAPVPQSDPAALARMQQEQQTPRQRPGILSRPVGMLKSGPDVSMAARAGTPTLTPQAEELGDTLTPGTNLSIVASGTSAGGTNSGGTGVSVEVLTPELTQRANPAPDSKASPGSDSSDPPPTGAAGVQAAPASGSGPGSSDAQANPAGQATQEANLSGNASQNNSLGSSTKNKKKAKKKAPPPAKPSS